MFVLGILLYTHQTYALSVDIQIADNFSVNNTINFSYSITSFNDVEVEYYLSVNCPFNLKIKSKNNNISLSKNESFSGDYIASIVNNTMKKQTCAAYLTTIKPNKQDWVEYFDIMIDPTLDFQLQLCNDMTCFVNLNQYKKGEILFIRYVSRNEPIVHAIIESPDKTRKEIHIPGSVVLELTGEYILEIQANQEGYLPYKDTIKISVTEENTINILNPNKLGGTIISDNDLVIPESEKDIDENPMAPYINNIEKKYSQQKSSKTTEEESNNPLIWFLLFVILSFVLTGIIISYKVKEDYVKIIQYIDYYVSKGYQLDAIIKKLSNDGYSKALINAAVKFVEKSKYGIK